MSLHVMSGRDIEVGLMELSQDVLPDVFPVLSAEVAAVPWPLPAVDVSVPMLSLRGRPLRCLYVSCPDGHGSWIDRTDSGYPGFAGRVSGHD